MKKDIRWISLAGVGTLAVILVAGCTGADQTGDGQTADSPEAAQAQKTLDNAQNGAKNVANSAGKTVVNGAQAVGNAATNAASGAKNLDDAATVTPTVKTALGANAALKGSKIDVSTTDKTVRLDGGVKTPAQKTLAGTIAKKNAPGYTILNNLKVG